MYRLFLTEQDTETIHFVGYRYCWSSVLRSLGEGQNDISESEAWEIKASFDADTEGGHDYLPMLDHNSDLAKKLFAFMEEIV